MNSRAAKIVSEGGVIAFRTDTFYGLGADPFNAAAVAKIRELKGREENKPILLLLSDASVADRFIADRSKAFEDVGEKILARAFDDCWRCGCESAAGDHSRNEELSACACLRTRDVRELVRVCGGALTATSANPSGREPARSAQEVLDYFGDGIDLVIDGGEVTATEPSTVLDVTTSPPRVVREGAIRAIDVLP